MGKASSETLAWCCFAVALREPFWVISVQGVSPQMLKEKLCVLAQAGLGSEQRVRLWLGALSLGALCDLCYIA